MKCLIEFNPPAEVKNEFEKNPELQKKVGEYFERLRPLSKATLKHQYARVFHAQVSYIPILFIHLAQMDVERLAFPDKIFDAAISTYVF